MPSCVSRATVAIAMNTAEHRDWYTSKSGGAHATNSSSVKVAHIRRSRAQRVTGNCWRDDQQRAGRRCRVLQLCRLSGGLCRKGRCRASPAPGRARGGSHRYGGLRRQPQWRRQSRWSSPLEPARVARPLHDIAVVRPRRTPGLMSGAISLGRPGARSWLFACRCRAGCGRARWAGSPFARALHPVRSGWAVAPDRTVEEPSDTEANLEFDE